MQTSACKTILTDVSPNDTSLSTLPCTVFTTLQNKLDLFTRSKDRKSMHVITSKAYISVYGFFPCSLLLYKLLALLYLTIFFPLLLISFIVLQYNLIVCNCNSLLHDWFAVSSVIIAKNNSGISKYSRSYYTNFLCLHNYLWT